MKQYRLTPITETAEQVTEAKSQKVKIAKQIVLGIDAHLNSYQVARKIDAGGIQPVQSFKLEKLAVFACKQLQLAEKVYAVYEAGPLGYVLYRKLKELGIEAMVCAPGCLEAGSKRKHNKIDASKLAGRVYNFLGGDQYALRIVRVPSPEQEQLRARSRQHGQLVRTRKSPWSPGPQPDAEPGLRQQGQLVEAAGLQATADFYSGVDYRRAGALASQSAITGPTDCRTQNRTGPKSSRS